MKKLRFQFGLFFVLLAVTLGVLLWDSYRQMNKEERDLWVRRSGNVYNQVQAEISDFLTREDQRSFSQYRYFYMPAEQGLRRKALMRSPLSRLPIQDPRGLIGYFQIDPNNVCTTPYIPQMKVPFRLIDEAERLQLQARLKELTQSLNVDLREPTAPRPAVSRRQFGFVELGPGIFARGTIETSPPSPPTAPPPDSLETPEAGETDKTTDYSNIYPNPLQEQIRRLERKQQATSDERDKQRLNRLKQKLENLAQLYPRRRVKIDSSQLKTFAEQNANMAQPSIYIDPFQARLVAGDTLIFYRKVWLSKKLYIQGFAMELDRFFSWLMGQSFANSELPDFAVAKLSLENHTLTGYGEPRLAGRATSLLYEHHLGYPLNRFVWQVFAAFIPHQSARLYLYALTLAIILLSTVGLYLIYRSAAAQVKLSQKREDFVSSVTHELKTPLTSIRMYSEMLEDGWTQNDIKKQEYYKQIHKESGRLSRLIDNVLQLARLEKGTYKIDLKTANPEQDFDELGKELAEIATQQGYHLQQERDDELPAISYDHEVVKQILLTLLDNSLKFTANSPNKTLEMQLRQQGEQLVWSWRDYGPGIPKGDLKKVFQKFYRVETEMTRKTQGTGIGLAMAHMLVDAMGAKITAINRETGGLEIRIGFRVQISA